MLSQEIHLNTFHYIRTLQRLHISIMYYIHISRKLMEQIKRSRVRVPISGFFFSIYIILPAALWPWRRLSLSQK
jgi:hypothetical protein